MAQVKRKSLPEESITVEGGPMPQVDPRQMYPVPPQIQPTQTPVSNDAMLLERVKQLRGGMQAPQPDAMRPSQVMYPMDRSAGMQADQMQAQIGVKPDPFAGMPGLKRMLAQGLMGAAEGSIHAQDPGGYNGWRQRQDQIEQQATNSQLEQVRSLRNEQLQRERMYQDELQNQQLREQQQSQFGAEQDYRNEQLKLAQAKELREAQPKPLAPKFSFQRGTPGQPYGSFDENTGTFAQLGTEPIITPPVNPEVERHNRAMEAAAMTRAQNTGGAAGAAPFAEGYIQERQRRIVESIDELLPKINAKTVGIGTDTLANIPIIGQEARDFRAQLKTLTSAIIGKELQEMRAASKTGGALGNVSDKETTILESALGALDPRQGPENMKAQLNKIKGSVLRWEAAKAGQNTPAPSSPAKPGPVTVEKWERGPDGLPRKVAK